jgi:RNA polymerase sigma-70 factor (ECF subfamily)
MRPASPLRQFLLTHAESVEWLLAKSAASRWGVTQTRFAQALLRCVERHFRGDTHSGNPTAAQVAAYLRSLHAEDLALACACSDGNEKAWEHFVAKYRHELYRAAGAILRSGDEARAHELADSIYAELYGLAPAGEPRRSLFDYFHGRSKLSTWLRAVLAQRHVDALRAGRRTESLEEKDEAYVAETLRAHGTPVPQDPDRARYLAMLQAALLEAFMGLSPRDRLRLAYYYVQEHTLAEIGRILGEHESSVSRNLDRTRRELRYQVVRALRAGRLLSDAQIDLCFTYALEGYPFDLTRALSPEASDPKPEEK